MGFTINLVLLKRRKKKNGEIPIYLRFTQNRKSRFKSTGISVLEKDWNPDAEPDPKVRKSHPRHKTLNDELERQLYEARDKKLELRQKGDLSITKVKKALKGEVNRTLLNYAERYEKQLDADDRYWEHRHFRVLMGNLEDFLNTRSSINITLGQVDSEFLEGFQKHLLNKAGPKKKGNSPNTVIKKMQRLKSMIIQAQKEKLIEHDPFIGFETVSKQPVEKTKLEPEQIEDINKLELDKGSELWHIRNYFMYSFYNAGIRFGDLCTLTWSDLVDGRLKYRMSKTGSLKSIKQQEPMNEILSHYRDDDNDPEDYIFPILEVKYNKTRPLKRAISVKNVIVNRLLKDLADMAGIQENLSFHISRHSWANFAIKKNLDLYTISKALGHSDLKITEQYLKSFDEEKLDDDLDGLYK